MPIQFAIAPINWSNDDDQTLGGDISLEQCLFEMRQAGFVGCELGHKFPKTVELIKEALKNYNLQITSDWIGTKLTEPEFYDQTIEDFKTRVIFLKQLGVKALKVCECGHSIQQSHKPIFSTKVEFSPRQWNLLFKGLNHMGQIAHDAGLFVAYHQHLGTGVENKQELNCLMANTDPELISLLPDTGHLFAAGIDPLETFSVYIDRIKYVHLKDVRQHIWEESKINNLSFMDAVRAGLFSVPGDGAINFTPIFELLQKNNYAGWLVVEAEQDPKKAHPLTYAHKARQFLRDHWRI